MEDGKSDLARASRIREQAALLVVKPPEVAAEWDDCTNVIREVCVQAGWLDVDELISEWIVPQRCDLAFARNPQAETMGVLVMSGNREFPMRLLRDGWPDLMMAGVKPAEIVLLAVKREYRSDGVNLALIREVARYSRQKGVTDLYAILDDRRFALYRSIGIPFHEVPIGEGGGRRVFAGEECFPAHFTCAEAVSYLQAHVPEVWSVLGEEGGETAF